MIEAVIFDLGGVVFESPLDTIAGYERDHGIELGTVNRVVMASGPSGAWARFERAELGYEAFCERFTAECAAHGSVVDADAMMMLIERATVPRPAMLATIDELRAGGWLVAALTNNWTPLAPSAFTARFDVVVESSVEGLRKPEPRIYELVLERLAIDAPAAVFLDDIGANLKPARDMGMRTIKVTDPGQAIEALWNVLGEVGV